MDQLSLLKKISTSLLRRLPAATRRISAAQIGHRFYTGDPSRARLRRFFCVHDPLLNVGLVASVQIVLRTNQSYQGPNATFALHLYPPNTKGRIKVFRWDMPVATDDFKTMLSSSDELAKKFSDALEVIYHKQFARLFSILSRGAKLRPAIKQRLKNLSQNCPSPFESFKRQFAEVLVSTMLSEANQGSALSPGIQHMISTASFQEKAQRLLQRQLVNFYWLETFKDDLDLEKLLHLASEQKVCIDCNSNLSSTRITISIGDFKKEYDYVQETK